jgi:UDP-glucose 4-epimerase
MKAVVTGGAGFIGSHLAELLLSKGLEVVVIDNLSTGRLENLKDFIGSCTFIESDLSVVSDSWMRHIVDADFVFHLASLADIVPSIERPLEYYNSNVTSTINILQSLSRSRIKKFVYAASSSCYGIASEFPTPETASVDPQYPYALTKYMGEELTMHWAKVYGIPCISTRFFNVYGTRSRTSGTYGAVFGVFLAQKLANKPLTIVGDGNQTRDFTYVSDVAQGLLDAALSTVNSDIFNIGSGKPQSVNRLAELIGGDVVYIPKRPGEPDTTHADISKAQSLIGYSPKISFEEGVQRVLDNIDYWSSAPVWTPDTISKATKPWFDFLR